MWGTTEFRRESHVGGRPFRGPCRRFGSLSLTGSYARTRRRFAPPCRRDAGRHVRAWVDARAKPHLAFIAFLVHSWRGSQPGARLSRRAHPRLCAGCGVRAGDAGRRSDLQRRRASTAARGGLPRRGTLRALPRARAERLHLRRPLLPGAAAARLRRGARARRRRQRGLEPARSRSACRWWSTACSSTARSRSIAVAPWPWRRSRIRPTTASSTSCAGFTPPPMRARRPFACSAATSRSAPTCWSAPRTSRVSSCTRTSVRISGCRCRRARIAALAGATVLANLSASNITVGQVGVPPGARARIVGAQPGGADVQRRRLRRVDGRPRLGRTRPDRRARPAHRRDRALRARRDARRGRRRSARAGRRIACARRRSAPTRATHRGRAFRTRRVRRRRRDARPPTVFTRLLRRVDPHPFVPADPALRDQRCREVFLIQATSLARRLEALPAEARRPVIGISGGQDSTQALLVAAHAVDLLGIERRHIVGVTMPGFGTTERTRGNARRLIEAIGATLPRASDHRTERRGLRRHRASARARGRHLRERAGVAAQAPAVRHRFTGARHRRRHRRPVRDRARLVHLWRRPHVALRRQRRRAEDADHVPHHLGG